MSRLPWAAQASLLLCLAAVLFLTRLGQAPLERAEIYFLDGARSMVERGDWLVPYYRGEPFFDKPALTYWLIALAFSVGAPTPFAARLVPAFAGLGVLLGTLWLGTLLYSRRTAALGGLVLCTTLCFMSFGRVAMSDMLLALWTVLAFSCAVMALRTRLAAPWLIALGAALGLGFLTKGPIALLLPGLGLLLLLRRERAELRHLRAGALLAAAAVCAALGLGWFVLVFLRLGWGPLAYFFLRENLERFAGATYDAGQPFWFYLPAYLGAGMPWSLFFPMALWRFMERPATGVEGDADDKLLLGWVGLMLIPLTLARGKIDYYLLPAYPALSLFIARWLVDHAWSRLDHVWARAAVTLQAAGWILLPLAVQRVPPEWLPGLGAQVSFVILCVAGALLALAVSLGARPPRVIAVTAGGAAALFLWLALFFLPAFRRGQPNRAIVADVLRERAYRADAALAVCDDPARAERDVLFEARLAAQVRCDLWNPAASNRPYMLLLEPQEVEALAKVPRLRPIADYSYLPARAFTFRGLIEGTEPGRLALVANYRTADPVAENKRRRDRKHALREAARLGELEAEDEREP